MTASPSPFLRAHGSSSSLPGPCPARCPSCSLHGDPHKTPRNLVVCIDGTANKFGRHNTNVVKLFEAVNCDNKDPFPEQYTYYSSGIGTRPRIFDVFQRVQRAISDKLDMAIAWNVEEIVKDAYAWLAGKYQEGDQIYLFGFSRGAYQVRILAWMIYEVGLIKNPTEKQIGTAYDHFDSVLSHKPNASDMAREFKMTFSWKDVRVHFMGVWDTVSSVGFVRGDVCLSASSTAAHACHIRHALALDERRVKFVPEYFLEMNSPDLHNPPKNNQVKTTEVEACNENGSGRADIPEVTIDHLNTFPNDGSLSTSSDGAVLEDRDGLVIENTKSALFDTTPLRRASSDDDASRKTADIKEVWFAGSHSDVGGTNRPGKTFHAGNVTLMWMCREASTHGLALKPGHILWTLWTDEDLDLGTVDSMTLNPLWKVAEFLPIRHEVSFSGSGKNARRMHLFEPRRIIPGQKIHASIRLANTYIPKATFGNGFGNPLETAGPMPSREDDIWEEGAIDHTIYVALFDYLTGRQGVAPFYLHKLLFLLRFTEGRSPIRDEPEWQKALADLITQQSGLVRLVAMAAYFEAVNHSDFEKTIPKEVFAEARQSLVCFIKPDQPDWPRAVALMRPLAKHRTLRDSILTADAVAGFLQLLDRIIDVRGEHFALVMDALSSLVELHSEAIIPELVEASNGNRDRLSLMLHTNDPRRLTAVLRVVIFLAERAPYHCHKVEPRLHELARSRKGPVSLLAVQALVEIIRAKVLPGLGLIAYPPPVRHRSPTLRSSELLGTVGYLHAGTTNITPAREWMRIGDSLLYKVFASNALGNNRREFIQKLLNAASGRHTRARTAGTFTLLKLCNFDLNLRSYVMEEGFLKILVDQLQYKDSALLAAYAMTRSLAHESSWVPMSHHPALAGYIVNMIRLDYFDDAIGITEGFAVFEDLLRCGELKRQIMGYDIAALLECKLGAGKPGEMRTSLVYLNILRNYGEESLTETLVERGMSHLKTDRWQSQKVGVVILCALAQTWFGAEALKKVIPEVVSMILPTQDSTGQQAVHVTSTRQPKAPASLLGPAFVLRVLANNESLREDIRQTREYGKLKHFFLFGDLLGPTETPIWHVWTPTRNDVLDVINQTIKSVDSVEGSTKGFILPDVRHWERIVHLLRDGALWAIVIPSAVVGVAALVTVGAIAVAPVVATRKLTEYVGRSWRLRQQNAIVQSLKLPDTESPLSESFPISISSPNGDT